MTWWQQMGGGHVGWSQLEVWRELASTPSVHVKRQSTRGQGEQVGTHHRTSFSLFRFPHPARLTRPTNLGSERKGQRCRT